MRGSAGSRTHMTAEIETLTRPRTLAAARQTWKRRNRLLLSVARALADVVVMNVAFAVAWWARYVLGVGPDVAEQNFVDLGTYYPIMVGLTITLLVVYSFNGLYRQRLGASWLDEVGSIAVGTTVGIAIMVIAVFYYRPAALSRLMFVYAGALIVVFLSLSHLLEHMLRAQLRRRGIGTERVLVVGAGSLGRMILQNIVAKPNLGFNVVGFVDDERTEDLGRFKALGKLGDITRLIWEQDLDQVIIALPAARHRETLDILVNCRKEGVSFRIVPDFYELSVRQVDINEINGIPLIGLKDMSMGSWALATKRVIDVIVSVVVIALASPLIGLIALAIKLDSPGPVIFKQVRLGRGGRPFLAYKFRSMKQEAEAELEKLRAYNEADGPIFKIREDPRVTRVGRWLRRTSLDELPQFFNILAGDMSLVGPRPPLPAEVESYEDWHRRRLDAPPGLTGLWQVSGRSNLTFDEMAMLDLWYIENWSLWLDLKIILQTVPAVLAGTGAY